MNKLFKLTLYFLALFALTIFTGCPDPKPPTPQTTYAVTVSSAGMGASGGGNYAAGTNVSINAGMPPAGQQFKNWTTASAGVSFTNANNASTTFVMPSNSVIDSYSTSSYPGSSVSGGIAGYVWDGAITRSYSSGNITSSSTSGGIAGSSEGYDSIISCAAINATINAGDDAGRIAGYIYYPESSEISNNFALAGMAAGGVAGFDAGDIQSHGIDKSDATLKTQSTYSGELGWKFGTSDASPWRMASGGYPSFYWE